MRFRRSLLRLQPSPTSLNLPLWKIRAHVAEFRWAFEQSALAGQTLLGRGSGINHSINLLASHCLAGIDDDARILELERLINVQFEKDEALIAQLDEDRNERMYEHMVVKKYASSEERHRAWLSDPHNVEQDAICDAAMEALAEVDPYIEEMFGTPAKTLAGRQAKLRVLKNWLWHAAIVAGVI